MNKNCTKCYIGQSVKNFTKHKTGKNGLNSICKKCAAKYHEEWVRANRERINNYSKIYMKKYIKTPQAIIYRAEYAKKHKKEKAQYMAAYVRTPEYKEKQRIYLALPKTKAKRHAFRISIKGKIHYAKLNTQRRGLGFNKLNERLNEPCEWHHIDKKNVLSIPRKLHVGIHHSQKNLEKINTLVYLWLLVGSEFDIKKWNGLWWLKDRGI